MPTPLQCTYSHTPDLMADADDRYRRCTADANFTCCDFGGPVCEQHKCRCSRPLTEEERQAYLQGG